MQHLSTLLFMAVGFLDNVSDFYELIEDQRRITMQEKISAHKVEAQKYLSELFGYIFFSTGGALQEAKTRVYELLILISRTAIKCGTDSYKCLMLTHDYLQKIPQIASMDELCMWLSKIANFSKVFKEEMDMTPLQYRKKNIAK